MRIGVFGGSFNPPHKMHESIASQLIKRGLLDKVIFVPTSNFYPKAGLINDEERYEMLIKMTNNIDEYVVSDCEFGKLTYTYQTLEYFQNKYPNNQIYFICGSDNLEQIDTWREWEKILGDYKLIVIPRKHDMDSLLNKYEKYRNNIIVAELDNDYLSSTLVRQYLKEQDYEKVKEYINDDVLEFIIKNNLYI